MALTWTKRLRECKQNRNRLFLSIRFIFDELQWSNRPEFSFYLEILQSRFKRTIWKRPRFITQVSSSDGHTDRQRDVGNDNTLPTFRHKHEKCQNFFRCKHSLLLALTPQLVSNQKGESALGMWSTTVIWTRFSWIFRSCWFRNGNVAAKANKGPKTQIFTVYDEIRNLISYYGQEPSEIFIKSNAIFISKCLKWHHYKYVMHVCWYKTTTVYVLCVIMGHITKLTCINSILVIYIHTVNQIINGWLIPDTPI